MTSVKVCNLLSEIIILVPITKRIIQSRYHSIGLANKQKKMKYAKMFYGNQYIGKVNVSGKRTLWSKIVFYFKRVAFVAIALDVVGWSMTGAYYYAKMTIPPKTVNAEVRVEVPTSEFPPILQRICQAESGGKQFLKNGHVVRGKVNPSDVGLCQINETIWNDTARDLGYDIYTEQGNKDMAVYIFNHYGSDPWSSSKLNWK